MITFEKKGVHLSPLFCDNLSFVIQYKKAAERDYVRKQMAVLKENDQGHYAHGGGKAKYKLGMFLYCEEYERVQKLLLQADPKCYCDHFLRVAFNPAHAHPWTVYWLLNQVLPGGWGDIPALATFTRFDATVDVIGLPIEDILVYYANMSRSRVFCKSGRLETYEMGAYEGDKRVVLYDKCAQLKAWNLKHAIKHPVPESATTRIEIVMRPSITLDGMLAMSNPFSGLAIVTVPPIKEATDLMFRLFVEVARLRGLHDALLFLPEGTRKKFKATLQKSACSWWQPDLVWASWSNVLSKLLMVNLEAPSHIAASPEPKAA